MRDKSPITEQLWNHLYDATFEVARQDAQLRDQNLALVAAIGELYALLGETLQTLQAVIPSIRPECAPTVLNLLDHFGRRGQAIVARLQQLSVASCQLSVAGASDKWPLPTANSRLREP